MTHGIQDATLSRAGGLRPASHSPGWLARRDFLKRMGIGAGALCAGPALASALAACGASTGPAGKGSGTLRWGLSAYPPTLNPFQASSTAANIVTGNVHRGLVGYDATGNIRPELAESWQMQDGGNTVVFSLRKNAVFHNGDPVTADDVKFSLDYLLTASNAAYHYGALSRRIDRVVVVDDHTVSLSLHVPDTTLLALLAVPYVPIVSKKELTANSTNFVGAGPFVYKTQQQGVKVEVTKFPQYYKAGLPKLESIVFTAYADDNLRVTALQSGDVDIIDFLPWQNLSSVNADPRLQLAGVDTGSLMFLQFNLTKPPFDNATVRQALGYAINRENVVQSAFFGSGATAPGVPIPPEWPYYDKSTAQVWQYDPQKAKSMLASAGYPNGFTATLLSNSTYSMHKDTALSVQQDLAKVGINCSVELPDWATRVARGNSGQYDFAVGGADGQLNDPDWLSLFLVGGAGLQRSVGTLDPRFGTLLASARATTDQAARKGLYLQVYELFNQTVPILPLTWRSQHFGLAKTVTGFEALPGLITNYSPVYSLEEVI